MSGSENEVTQNSEAGRESGPGQPGRGAARKRNIPGRNKRGTGSGEVLAGGIPVRCAYDEIVAEAALLEHPRNPNRHPPEQLRIYLKVIQGNGWRRPIVVSKRSRFVVKGNGALQAARLGGLKKVPVNYQDYATEEAEIADMLADNELARYAVRDEAQLEQLLGELEAAGTDTELAGLIRKLEEEPELKPLQVIPPPKMSWVLIGIPLVRYGDINEQIEKISAIPDVLMESTVSDHVPNDKNG